MTKRVLRTLLMAVVISLSFSMTAYARKSKCGYNGCTRSTEDCHNGTVFCDTHAAVYAREQGYKVCASSGCYARAVKDGSYCSSHTCKYRDCKNKATQSDGYCSTHSSDNSTKNKKSAVTTTTPSKKKTAATSGKKSSSSTKKKYEMPDCDDYEDYDDFMDDWDGCMPDGSDAEDYWDNW